MEKMKKQRKGFTLTELAVVIAVIAILVAVLVPTFMSIINKANESADQQLVKNLNTILTVDGVQDSIETPSDALDAVEAEGYSVEKMTPRSSGDIIYDQTTATFALVSDGVVTYPSDSEIDLNAATTWYFVSSQEEIADNATVSYILTGEWDSMVTYVGVGGIETSRATVNAAVYINRINTQTTADANVQAAKTSVKKAAESSVSTYPIIYNVIDAWALIYKPEEGVTLPKLCGNTDYNVVDENNEAVEDASMFVEVSATSTAKVNIDYSIKITTDTTGTTSTTVSVTFTVSGVEVNATNVTVENGTVTIEVGNEKYPYLIDDVDDLNNVKTGTKDNIIYYQLNADIDLKDSSYNYGAYKLADVYFDGNGHEIYCSTTKSLYGVFCYVYNTVTIVNLNYDLSNMNHRGDSKDLVPFVYEVTESDCYNGSTDLTIKDVTITGTHTVNSNNGPFVFHDFMVNNSSISFVNCEMAANLSGNGYNSCFIGWQGDWDNDNDGKVDGLVGGSISFTGCTVSGSLVCEYAGMYTANSSNAYKKTYTFSDNVVTGTVRGTSTVNLFCGNGKDVTGTIYTSAVAGTNYTSLNVFKGATDSTLAITADSEGNLSITASDNSSVTKYIIYVYIYTNYYEDGVSKGTWLFSTTQTITVADEAELSTILKNIGFVDASYCTANNITTKYDAAGNEYAEINGGLYYVVRDFVIEGGGQGYVGSPTQGGISSAKNNIRICAYVGDTLYSSAELTK